MGGDCDNSEESLDHAVQLIGYSTDPASNIEYFILRNSWGTTWGKNGYMWIENVPTGNGVLGLNITPVIPQTTNYHETDASV